MKHIAILRSGGKVEITLPLRPIAAHEGLALAEPNRWRWDENGILINLAEVAAIVGVSERAWAEVYPDQAIKVEPEGLRDSLGTACASCGHARNFHEYSDLRCTVKLDQHGFARCGCAYRSPYAEQAATNTGS